MEKNEFVWLVAKTVWARKITTDHGRMWKIVRTETISGVLWLFLIARDTHVTWTKLNFDRDFTIEDIFVMGS